MNLEHQMNSKTEGKFVELKGERYYQIENVDQMAPFFISVVSSGDHWLFISSAGSLSAGRIRPENALFPYKSVDHIHESAGNTGPKTIIWVRDKDKWCMWEPFNSHHDHLYIVTRNLYKSALGDKILFEEMNHSLGMRFRYSWNTSERFGFVRQSELTDLSGLDRETEVLDGIQNILPSGAPLAALQTRSALVDAYKWNEKLPESSLALYSMYAKLSDRAEPAESLRATTVFSVDEESRCILLSSQQLNDFRHRRPLTGEDLTRGVRGSYFICKTGLLQASQSKSWMIVADIDKSHSDISRLRAVMSDSSCLASVIEDSVALNQKELIDLMSGGDAWQMTADENTHVHHYANVLFNSMRGGIFENNYEINKQDLIATIGRTNRLIADKYADFFDLMPDAFTHADLMSELTESGDPQLIRLGYEYLPLTFGRRHGDPSRPWNHYEIKLKDEHGERLLSYQGNWRDIFQNWEALALSYPGFIFSFLAKFVNASTIDGYNPYRITKEGVDWEILDPQDPWSNIGYWGDHQIIYLLKFFELADKYQYDGLVKLMAQDIFSYANVPYELCSVEKLFENPKDTVSFNHALQHRIEARVQQMGSDGRLIADRNGEVYLVNLTEKMLVPLLAKLSNLVLDGGIWLNTQRPEWNDANNAIVGNGLSMVTLYYLRRYVSFMQKLIKDIPSAVAVSKEVLEWALNITRILQDATQAIHQGTVNRQTRKSILTRLEKAADDYRQRVYHLNGFSGKTVVETAVLRELLTLSEAVLDASIAGNRRQDGLYNAYNIVTYSRESLTIDTLYPMLEGQVAVLSSGVLTPAQAVELLDHLFTSEMYREDQHSFMLYPDRDLSSFLEKNLIPAECVRQNPLLVSMTEKNDRRIVQTDDAGASHFHPEFENAALLREAIDRVRSDYPEQPECAWQQLEQLYETVFHHKAFTGRSGTMFGYEGLGCIYWHMVSKLLLAVQENYLAAWRQNPASEETGRLASYYYLVREGIGFNKTPDEYGAFPTDPYSHTPKHAGAQQPGMTGQVKEEILTRFGELGLMVNSGRISVSPTLLKASEFLSHSSLFTCLNLSGEQQSYVLQAGQLAFTFCQVPFIYQLTTELSGTVTLTLKDETTVLYDSLTLSTDMSASIFERKGEISKVLVTVPESIMMK
ncbi:hypothetical protein VA7868_04237 [Vibrio aerogenes CECT 7868]|uniref:Uncharacterized protein n=1 Tax=Vibrio aerogenes CECT 7868 TaxID=1216006 RepID=A0A1M6DIF9_9VIBR|nr:hypothetical protein [Vibrio aerogenes]SHI72839.1 hypothetical protein VA7868_04237 [Vibrio aerogenes CECT 7868]